MPRHSLAFAALLLPVAFAAAGAAHAQATLIDQHTDASGKITVALFEQIAPTPTSRFINFEVEVPSDYIAIGGGVEGAEAPFGHYLTASVPSLDLSAWLVSTSDLNVADPVQIKAWAIGLKIAGLTRDELRQHVKVRKAISTYGPLPDIAVSMPARYVQIGGGYKVHYVGNANVAWAGYPLSSNTWRAASKQHIAPVDASIEAYSIGLHKDIPGVGRIVASMKSTTSGFTTRPRGSASVGSAFARTGCGALVNWTGTGNLLWMLKPIAGRGCEAAAKDDTVSSQASIRTTAVGIRVLKARRSAGGGRSLRDRVAHHEPRRAHTSRMPPHAARVAHFRRLPVRRSGTGNRPAPSANRPASLQLADQMQATARTSGRSRGSFKPLALPWPGACD